MTNWKEPPVWKHFIKKINYGIRTQRYTEEPWSILTGKNNWISGEATIVHHRITAVRECRNTKLTSEHQTNNCRQDPPFFKAGTEYWHNLKISPNYLAISKRNNSFAEENLNRNQLKPSDQPSCESTLLRCQKVVKRSNTFGVSQRDTRATWKSQLPTAKVGIIWGTKSNTVLDYCSKYKINIHKSIVT